MKVTTQISVSFLLKEYEYLSDLSKSNGLDVVFNTHLKLTAYLLALIPVFFSLVSEMEYRLVFISALTLFIIILETILFKKAVDKFILSNRDVRALNKIRRFFYDNDISIRPYIAMPIVDNYPPFKLSYKVRCSISINTALVLYLGSFLISSLPKKYQNILDLSLWFLILFAVALFIYILQKTYSSLKLKKANKKYVSRFPTTLSDCEHLPNI